jgi:hypothetical protein
MPAPRNGDEDIIEFSEQDPFLRQLVISGYLSSSAEVANRLLSFPCCRCCHSGIRKRKVAKSRCVVHHWGNWLSFSAGNLCIWVKWAPNLASFAAAFCSLRTTPHTNLRVMPCQACRGQVYLDALAEGEESLQCVRVLHRPSPCPRTCSTKTKV